MAKIKVNYELLREMRQAFTKGGEELNATRAQVKKITEMMDGGGLKGVGGSALSEALGVALDTKLHQLIEKFEEMVIDLQAVETAFRREDTAAANEQGL